MLLFRVGKEVLIKVVGQFIPTYTMEVFQLPIKLCDELDAVCKILVGTSWEWDEDSLEKLE